MTDFSPKPHESFRPPEPPSDEPEAFVPTDTPMTAPNPGAEPIDYTLPPDDAPPRMTAQDWDYDESFSSDDVTPELAETNDGYISLDQEPDDLRAAVVATAGWLGPRLAEMEYPPDAGNYVDPDIGWEHYDVQHDGDVPDFATGWLMAAAAGRFDERQWSAATVLLASGRIAHVESTRLASTDLSWTLRNDPGAEATAIDEGLMEDFDSDLASGRATGSTLVPTQVVGSRAIATALNALIRRVKAARVDQDDPFSRPA